MNWKTKIINYLLLAVFVVLAVILTIQFSKEQYNLTLVLIATVFIIATSLSLLLFNRKILGKEEKYMVKLDDDNISCLHPDKPNETVLWKDVSEVVIVTTDKGPHEPYIWVLLSTEGGKGCVFPLGAKNSQKAIEKIIGFPGLNLTLWAEALKSTDNKRFVVWRKQVNTI